MGLSPEEKRRIYEEEKARIEAREKIEKKKKISEGASSTSLKPNVAGLLCYLGVWVTGIIFLIIERKNRIIRFHAMQSLVTFGILGIIIAIADAVRRWASWAGWEWFSYPLGITASVVFGVFLTIAFVLWIVLMYRAYHNRPIRLSLFGDLAQKCIAKLDGINEEELEQGTKLPKSKTEPESLSPTAAKEDKQTKGESGRYPGDRRGGRLASSIAAIVWSSLLLVFFNFFSEYLAYYQREIIDGITKWNLYPLLTQDFSLVLPILNATLILSIVGRIILIIFDKYMLRQIILIVVHIFGLVTTLTFLNVFPFDFSVIPHSGVAGALPTVAIIVMVIIAVALGIEALVRFIKLMVNIVKKRDSQSYKEV